MPQILQPYRTSKVDTILLSALVAVSSTVQAVTGEFSPAISREASTVSLYISVVPFGLGALLVLVGAVWRGRNLIGLELELVGRSMLVLPAAAYGAAILDLAGVQGLLTASFCIAFALSSAYRAWFISKKLRELHFDLRSMRRKM